MKRQPYFLLCITIYLLAGCDAMETHKFKSYVTTYFELNTFSLLQTSSGNIEIIDRSSGSYSWNSKGTEKRTYDDLCEKNGDTSYNKKLSFIGAPDEPRSFSVQTINKIEVISNADWDADHPAGALLNDITILLSMSPYKYIRSGYKNEFDWANDVPDAYRLEESTQHLERGVDIETKHPVYGYLSELNEDDFSLMGVGSSQLGWLVFENKPTLTTQHEVTVSLYLDNGKKISAQLTINFN